MSLVARYLEENNLSTVIIGSARDIVEECGVPRFIFSDFPLGNPCGKPWDVAMQHAIMGMALDLLERAWMPRTTMQTPFRWDNEEWREKFMRVDESNLEALAKEGELRRQIQTGIKKDR
ncbi:MAG: hypothetical protein JW925_07425 [Syntrophaceae bacterium]|nr:hypothetical protein [Syntrophaceae bacterium]